MFEKSLNQLQNFVTEWFESQASDSRRFKHMLITSQQRTRCMCDGNYGEAAYWNSELNLLINNSDAQTIKTFEDYKAFLESEMFDAELYLNCAMGVQQ